MPRPSHSIAIPGAMDARAVPDCSSWLSSATWPSSRMLGSRMSQRPAVSSLMAALGSLTKRKITSSNLG